MQRAAGGRHCARVAHARCVHVHSARAFYSCEECKAGSGRAPACTGRDCGGLAAELECAGCARWCCSTHSTVLGLGAASTEQVWCVSCAATVLMWTADPLAERCAREATAGRALFHINPQHPLAERPVFEDSGAGRQAVEEWVQEWENGRAGVEGEMRQGPGGGGRADVGSYVRRSGRSAGAGAAAPVEPGAGSDAAEADKSPPPAGAPRSAGGAGGTAPADGRADAAGWHGSGHLQAGATACRAAHVPALRTSGSRALRSRALRACVLLVRGVQGWVGASTSVHRA
jgi:hypothetical protein